MKKILLALGLVIAANGYSQLGWESYTGQPTSTMYGGVGGAALGYMLAPAISKGPDAQWIGALTGLAAGGLVGNYMAGDNNTHQKLMRSGYNDSDQKAAPVRNVEQGIRVNKNVIQSPYSDYVVKSSDFSTGQVVTDPLTGQVFRIPR